MSLVTRRPRFELLLEKLQIVSVHVRNSPVVEVRISPMQKLIAFMRHRHCRSSCSRLPRPNKQVNEMLTPLVNQGRHRPVIEIIKTATNQRKSLTGKIDHWRSKIELRVQPGFYSMLIRRSDVGEVICHQRTHMAGDELRRQELIGPGSLQSGHQGQSDDRSENDRRGESQPIPGCLPKNSARTWLPSWEQRLSISRNVARGQFGDLVSQRGLNSLT